jgi:hypothetical protein
MRLASVSGAIRARGVRTTMLELAAVRMCKYLQVAQETVAALVVGRQGKAAGCAGNWRSGKAWRMFRHRRQSSFRAGRRDAWTIRQC